MVHQEVSIGLSVIVLCAAALCSDGYADEPVVRFVSVPDFINMDLQLNDPRLFDLTADRQAALVADISAGGPQADINPHVGNFVGTVENGYRGASQVLLEALAEEGADFLTVSGDLLYTRWPKGSQLSSPGAEAHISEQADIYYDGWIENVTTYSEFGLDDVYTIVGDHEIGDNNWGAAKRRLIPAYRSAYTEKVGNPSLPSEGTYVESPAGFEGRTYAVQRGNLLLVGIDQFETFDSAGNSTNVGSQIASVDVDVTGGQLNWLDTTLAQANNDASIDHVVVLGHAPIAGRDTVKVQATSSGLMNKTGENGPLWQTLANYDVDLYLPGEVHEISMQSAHDVLQVVTGTNIFQPADQPGVNNIGFHPASAVGSEENYLVVEAYEDRIELVLKQIETRIWGQQGAGNDPLNNDPYKNRETRVAVETAEQGFQVTGTLTIDTSGDRPVYRNRTGMFLTEWTFGAPINLDLNGDDQINALDAQQFLAGLHGDLTGLTPQQAAALGDLNSDLVVDHTDFRLFKEEYLAVTGTAPFATVPEPSTWVQVVVTMATIWGLTPPYGRSAIRAIQAESPH